MCAHPDLTAAHTCSQGPSPLHSCCYSGDHPGHWSCSAHRENSASKLYPYHGSIPGSSTDLAGGIRECFPDTPQSIGLPQRALHPPHPPTLLSTPVIRGRKRALGLDNFAKRPELVHPHITSPCNQQCPPTACLIAPPLLPTPRKPHQWLCY